MIQRTTRGPPNAQTGSTSNQLTPKAPYKPAPAKAGGTRWDQVLFVLVAYRLLAPGSEWRLPREWFQRSALADLLGEDAGLAEIHKLYRCHDRLLTHKQAVFDHLGGRWRDLFKNTTTHYPSPRLSTSGNNPARAASLRGPRSASAGRHAP